MNKIVVACVTADDLTTIHRLANQSDTEVIAVAFDLGGHSRLRELQDQAVAAGCRRCHVVDLREEFARDFLLPALQQQCGADEDAIMRTLARACMAKKLAQIAELEGATDVHPIERNSVPTPFATAYRTANPDRSAQVAISFKNHVPIAINDVPMSIVEVIESLGILGASHGLEGSSVALRTLQSAYQEIAGERLPGDACAWLELNEGTISSAAPAYLTV